MVTFFGNNSIVLSKTDNISDIPQVKQTSINKNNNILRGLNGALYQSDANGYFAIAEEDYFIQLKNWNVNVVRYFVNENTFFDKNLDENNQKRLSYVERHRISLNGLDQAVKYAEKHRIHIIVTLGKFGDRTQPMPAIDEEKLSLYYQNIIILWEYIANRYRNKNAIYAYDLINEPVFRLHNRNWFGVLIPQLIKKIRQHDSHSYIMIQPSPWGLPKAFKHLKPLPFKRVLYSFHLYHPHNYTHQGIKGRKRNLTYPGNLSDFNTSKTQYWNKNKIEDSLRFVIKFQSQIDSPIFVGEFGVVRWAIGAEKWIEDCISIYEKHSWSWCYHSYGGWNGWNPTFASESEENKIFNGGKSTPRLGVLKKYWTLNRHN